MPLRACGLIQPQVVMWRVLTDAIKHVFHKRRYTWCIVLV